MFLFKLNKSGLKIPSKPKLVKYLYTKHYIPYGEFECSCGKLFVTQINAVKTGHAKSCGCYYLRASKLRHLKHGHTKSYFNTPTYRTWNNMKQRCFNSKNTHYKNYGGRGITVCKRWRIFDNFLEDMGSRPNGKTIDRINNDGNYEKNNCKWSSKRDQFKNRRNMLTVTINNESMSLLEAYDQSNSKIDYRNVSTRVKSGWPFDIAIKVPVGSRLREHNH